MSAESAAYPMAQPPRRSKPIVSNGVLGMLVFIFTEVMFFAGLISAHSVVRSETGELWPPPGQPRLPVQETAVNTAALLVSGIVLVIAWFAFRREKSSARIPLLLSILLGAFFVGFQGMEWVGLIAEGLTIKSSAYGGFFYLIVGAHALHAVGAIIALGWAWFRLIEDRLSTAQLATVSAFWYFVVLVWPVLYLTVYL